MRVLLVISASPDPELAGRVAEGRSPRKDYLELADAVGGTILFRDAVRERPLTRIIARVFGLPMAQAVLAFLRRREFDVVFSDAENIGLPLALLLKIGRLRRRHVMIGHLPSTRWKRPFFRFLRVQSHIDAIICHASLQRWILIRQLGVSEQKVALMPYGVDERFWRPSSTSTDTLMCSVGLEYRDYPTLIEAVRGLELDLVIAAASHWSRRKYKAGGVPLPPNVQVTAMNYEDLRRLYAESRFVVVPLHDVDFQAGITTILEAMAMARAVIVTETRGQRDVVRGTEGLPAPLDGGPRAGFPDLNEEHLGDLRQTGLYVPPANTAALREAIEQLAAHPELAKRLGAEGRRLVERSMTLDQYVARIATLLTTPTIDVQGC